MPTPYTNAYAVRYTIASIREQTETAVITAAGRIFNEDPATPGHAERVRWATWANHSSSVAGIVWFGWSVALDPAVAQSIADDPSGAGVEDAAIQAVVDRNLEKVIAAWLADQPQTGAPATATPLA